MPMLNTTSPMLLYHTKPNYKPILCWQIRFCVTYLLLLYTKLINTCYMSCCYCCAISMYTTLSNTWLCLAAIVVLYPCTPHCLIHAIVVLYPCTPHCLIHAICLAAIVVLYPCTPHCLIHAICLAAIVVLYPYTPHCPLHKNQHMPLVCFTLPMYNTYFTHTHKYYHIPYLFLLLTVPM